MAQTLTTSQILADLQAGLTRKDIGAKYGLNGVQVSSLFKNPTLKHKKTVKEKGAAFILVDDVAQQTAATETANEVAAETVEETAEVQENAFEQADVAEEVVVEEEAAPEIQPEPVIGERSMWGE